MSNTSSSTEYVFTVGTGTPSDTDYGQWVATTQGGMTDAFASQIVEALKAITPPTGVTITATVQKQDNSSTSYTTNYSTNPITFN